MKKWAALIGIFAMLFAMTGDQRPAKLMSAPADVELPKVPYDLTPKLNCPNSVGTGIVVSNKLIVTAAHVAEKNNCEIRSKMTRRDPRVFKNYRYDEELDFALIRGSVPVRNEPFKVNCSGFETGKTYYMIGYPHGGNRVIIPVTAASEYFNADVGHGKRVPHLRALNGMAHPGMSGGPVIGEDGQVYGILSSVMLDGSGRSLAREFGDTFICADK